MPLRVLDRVALELSEIVDVLVRLRHKCMAQYQIALVPSGLAELHCTFGQERSSRQAPQELRVGHTMSSIRPSSALGCDMSSWMEERTVEMFSDGFQAPYSQRSRSHSDGGGGGSCECSRAPSEAY